MRRKICEKDGKFALILHNQLWFEFALVYCCVGQFLALFCSLFFVACFLCLEACFAARFCRASKSGPSAQLSLLAWFLLAIRWRVCKSRTFANLAIEAEKQTAKKVCFFFGSLRLAARNANSRCLQLATCKANTKIDTLSACNLLQFCLLGASARRARSCACATRQQRKTQTRAQTKQLSKLKQLMKQALLLSLPAAKTQHNKTKLNKIKQSKNKTS